MLLYYPPLSTPADCRMKPHPHLSHFRPTSHALRSLASSLSNVNQPLHCVRLLRPTIHPPILSTRVPKQPLQLPALHRLSHPRPSQTYSPLFPPTPPPLLSFSTAHLYCTIPALPRSSFPTPTPPFWVGRMLNRSRDSRHGMDRSGMLDLVSKCDSLPLPSHAPHPTLPISYSSTHYHSSLIQSSRPHSHH